MNASTYLKNVGKSMGYMAVDIYKDLNPVTSSFISDSKEFGEELYSSVQDFKGKIVDMNNDPDSVLGIAKSTVTDIGHNILSDLKSGKWYNKQRYDDLTTEAALGDMGFTEEDFNFNWADDDDSSFDDDDSDLSDDTKAQISSAKRNTITNIKSMDRVGQKISGAIGTSTFKSAQYIGEVNKLGFKEVLRVSNKGFASVTNGLAAVNSNISALVQLGEPLTQHINNSATFYTKTTEWQEGITQRLDKLITLVSPASPRDRPRSDTSVGDFLTTEGALNLSSLKDYAVNNIKDMTSMITMFTDMMSPKLIAATLKGNPLGSLLKFGVEGLMPKAFKSGQMKLDSALSNLFGGFLTKLKNGRISSDNDIINSLLDLITPNSGYKGTMNPSNYTKGKVDWDGKSRRALMDVIPHYLAQITSALTGNPMQIYDYENGRWITTKNLKKDFEDTKRGYASFSGGDYMDGLRNMVISLSNQEGSGMNQKQAQQFMNEVGEFNSRAYHSDSDEFTKILSKPKNKEEEKERIILAAKYGLSQNSLALIDSYNEGLKANGKLGQKNRYATDIETGRGAFSRFLNMSEDDGSVFLKLFDNSLDFNTFASKDKDTGNTKIALKDRNNVLMNLKDQYNNNIFFYLQGIYQNSDFFAENFDLLVDQGAFNAGQGGSGKRQTKVRGSAPLAKNYKLKRRDQAKTIFRNNDIPKSVGDTDNEDEEQDTEAVGSTPNQDLINSIIKGDDEFNEYSSVMRGINSKMVKHTNNSDLSKEELVALKKYYQNKVDNVNQKQNDEYEKILEQYINSQKLAYKADHWLKSTVDNVQNKLGIANFGTKLDKFSDKTDQMIDNWLYNNVPFLSALFGEGEVGNKSGGLFSGVANKVGKAGKDLKSKLFKGIEDNEDEVLDINDESGAGSGLLGISAGRSKSSLIGKYFKVRKNKDIIEDTGKVDKNGNHIYRVNGTQLVIKTGKRFRQFLGKLSDAGEKVNETVTSAAMNNKDNIKEKVNEAKSSAKTTADKAKDFGKEYTDAVYRNFLARFLPKDEKRENKTVEEVAAKAMKDAGINTNSIITGALAGGGLSIVTGAVVNPLLGAAIGAGVGLVSKSKTLQDVLFGKEITIEKDGKEINTGERSGGVLSKKISNFIMKNTKGLQHGVRGAAIGGIAGTFLGSPIVGSIVGSTIGFVKNSDQAKETLFGKTITGPNGETYVDDSKAWIKQSFIKEIKGRKLGIATGAGAGAAVSLLLGGPFGLVGNVMVGSAIGFAVDNEKFKEDLFGKVVGEGKQKHREGGLVGMIKDRVIDPVSEILRNGSKMLVSDIKSGVKNLKKKIYEKVLKKAFTKLKNTRLGRKVAKVGNAIYDTAKGVAKAAIRIPTMPIVAARDKLKQRAFNNNYGWTDANGNDLTAEQREKERYVLDENGNYKTNEKGERITKRGYKRSEADENLMNMSSSELQDAKNLTQILKNPQKLTETIDSQYRDSKQNTLNMMEGFSGLSVKQKNKFKDQIINAKSEKDLYRLQKSIEGLKGLTLKDQGSLINLIEQQKKALTYKIDNDAKEKEYKDSQSASLDAVNNLTGISEKQRNKWLRQISGLDNGFKFDDIKDQINASNLSDEQKKNILQAISDQRTIFDQRNKITGSLDEAKNALSAKFKDNLNDPEKLERLIDIEIKARQSKESDKKEQEKSEAKEDEALNIKDIAKNVVTIPELLENITKEIRNIKNPNGNQNKADVNYSSRKDKKARRNEAKRENIRRKYGHMPNQAYNIYRESEKEESKETETEIPDNTITTEESASGSGIYYKLRSLLHKSAGGSDDSPKSGDTREDPSTGEVQIYSNGKWVSDEESTETNQAQKDKKEHSGFMKSVSGFGTNISSIASNMSSLVKGLLGKKEKKKSFLDTLGDGIKKILFGSTDGSDGLLGGLFSFFTGVKSGKGIIGTLLSKYNLTSAISSGLGIGAILFGLSNLLGGTFDKSANKMDANQGKANSQRGVNTNASYTGIQVIDANGNLQTVAVDEKGKPVKNSKTENYVGTDGKDITGSADNTLKYTGATATDNLSTRAKKSIVRGVLTGTASVGSLAVKGISKNLNNVPGGKLIKSVGKSVASKAVTKVGKLAAKSGVTKMIAEQIVKLATKLGKLPFFKGAAKSMENFGLELSSSVTEAVTKQSAGAAAKVGKSVLSTAAFIAKLVTIAWDFEEGWNDASATLKVSEPTTGQKAISGVIRALKNCIPVVGMLIPDATIVDIFVKYVAPALGMDVSEFNKQREDAEEELDEYNDKNGTNYSWSEYTKQVKGNYTWGEKIGNGAKALGGKVVKGIKKIGTNVKDEFVDIGNNVKSSIDFIQNQWKESKDALYNGNMNFKEYMTVKDPETDEVMGGFAGALAKTIRLIQLPVALYTSTGKMIYKAFEPVIEKVKSEINTVDQIHTTLKGYMYKGDIKGLWTESVNDVDDGDSETPLSPFNKVETFSSKLVYSIPTLLVAAGSKIKDAFKTVIGNTADNFSTLSTTIDSMNTAAENGSIKDVVKVKFTPKSVDVLKPIEDAVYGVSKLFMLIKAGLSKFAGPIKTILSKIGVNVRTAFYDTTKKVINASNSGSGSGLTGVSAGSSFISQLSSSNRNKNVGFNNIGEKGCGPAAAAMADGDSNMNDAIADASNYQTAGGTDAAFFGDYFAKKGKSTSYMDKASDIADSIASGKPTVLMGRDSFNTSKANSPFGPNNHYVVANGIDSSGNILINDPEQSHGNVKYNPSILNNVSLGVGVGSGSGLIRMSGGDSNLNNTNKASKSMSRLQAIFQYLKGIGLTDIAAAAIMGCWDQESSNKPNRVEGDYLSSYPGTDKVLASPESAQDYTKNILFPAYKKSNVKINESAYRGRDGYLYPGVGLAAWTGPRASDLWSYAKGKGEDWKTLAAQLDFFTNYSGEFGSNKSLQTTMNKESDVSKATIDFFDKYEMGGNGASVRKAHPDWISNRQKAAKNILSSYGGTDQTLKLEDLKNINLTDLNMTGGEASSSNTTSTDSTSGDSSSSSSSSSSSGNLLTNIIGAFTKGLSKFTINGMSVFGSSDSSDSSSSTSTSSDSSDSSSTGEVTYGDDSGYSPKLGKGADPVDYMESILGKISYSMKGPRDPEKGSADCSSTVNWAIKKAGGPDTGGYTGAEQTNANLHDVINGKGATLTQEQLGGSNYSKLKRNDMLLFTRDYAKQSPSVYPNGVGHVGLYMGNGKYIDHGSGMGPQIKNMPGTGLTQVRRLNDITWDKSSSSNSTSDSATSTQSMMDEKKLLRSGSGSGLSRSAKILLYHPTAGASGLEELATTASNSSNSYNNSNAGIMRQSSNIYDNSSSRTGINQNQAKTTQVSDKVDKTTALMLKTIVTLVEKLVSNTAKVDSIYSVLSTYINNGGGSGMSAEQSQAILKAATTYTDTTVNSQANTKTEDELSSLKKTIDDILSA